MTTELRELNFQQHETILNSSALTKAQIIELIPSEANEEKEELLKDVSCPPIFIPTLLFRSTFAGGTLNEDALLLICESEFEVGRTIRLFSAIINFIFCRSKPSSRTKLASKASLVSGNPKPLSTNRELKR